MTATGARPGENSGKRELFTESTTTALVFPNGGVIRLSAAVEPGQLLFLTNQRTKLEVVTQVTRKRTNPATGYYVELEFTEPAPGFWGIEFPEAPAPAPANVPPPPAAQLMQSAAPEPGDLDPNAPAPSAEEVQALMEEVEALREQLRSMQSQAGAPSAAAGTSASPANAAPQLAAMLSALIAPPPAVLQAAPASVPQDSPEPVESARPAEPSLAESERTPVIDALLPKPALDFHQAKPPQQPAAIPAPAAASGDRLGSLRLGLLTAVSLFAVSAAAWNMHWLPWTTEKPSLPAGTSSPVRPAGKSPSTAVPVSQQKPDAHLDAAAAPSAVALPTQSNAAGPSQPAGTSADVTASGAPDDSASSVDTAAKPAPRKDSVAATPVAKRSTVRPSPEPDASSTPASDDSADLVPPRLIKSVRARAPSAALREFVTGNVTIDALIDKTGQVKSMKVLSGPASFHKAAMDALKLYRYEPARQNGKPVSAHVTVTVPFWFEP